MQAGHFAQCVVLLRIVIVTIHQWESCYCRNCQKCELVSQKNETKETQSSYGEYYVADQEQKRERDLIGIITLLVVLVC